MHCFMECKIVLVPTKSDHSRSDRLFSELGWVNTKLQKKGKGCEIQYPTTLQRGSTGFRDNIEACSNIYKHGLWIG